MDVYLLRHGEAGKVTASMKDSERPLTVSGREEVGEVARGLKKLKLGLDVIATSPLRRSHETAVIVGKELGLKKVEDWAELMPEGQRASLVSRLGTLKTTSSVLLVGHEPYLSLLVGDLTGGGCKLALKKSGMARVVVSSLSPKAGGELRWLLTARQIKRMS